MTTTTPFHYIFYLMAVSYLVLEIYIIMYFGNEIECASDQLSTCLFQCDWINQPIGNRKYVVTLMEFLRQPRRIFVGYWIVFPLDLETFTSVC